MDQLRGCGGSHGTGVGNISRVADVSTASVFSPSDLLFLLSSSGFASFPLSRSSSLPFTSSFFSFGISTVAPFLPPLPILTLPSVLAVSAPHPSPLPPPPTPPGFLCSSLFVLSSFCFSLRFSSLLLLLSSSF